MLVLILLVGLAVALSGPAFEDWRQTLAEQRRRRLDGPTARVVFLLPSSCRDPEQGEPG